MSKWAPALLAVLGAAGLAFMSLGLAAVVGFLVWRGGETLGLTLLFGDVPPWEALTGRKPVWDGIWPAVLGTLSLVGLTMFLALPPGLGGGVFLAEYASPRQRRVLGTIMDMAAGVPSIVMGLFGFTLVLILRRFFPAANTCLLLAAFCLALLVLPALTTATREALAAVPDDLRLSAAALGFSKGESLRLVLLPAAGSGVLGGVILSVGRAAEDAAVIMLTGAVANAGFFGGPFGKFQALPFTVYYTAAQYQTQGELARGFGAALFLLALSSALFAGAGLIERAWRRSLRGYGRSGGGRPC